MNINLTLIGQMITFVIFIIFTVKFVWPPLKTSMDDRKHKIAEGLASFDRAKKKLEISSLEAKKIIDEAKSKAEKIIEYAKFNANKINESAKELAKNNANRILQSAKTQSELLMLNKKEQIRKEIINISILSTEKLLQKTIDTKQNQEFIEKIISNI